MRWDDSRGNYVLTGTGRSRISARSRVPGAVVRFKTRNDRGDGAPHRKADWRVTSAKRQNRSAARWKKWIAADRTTQLSPLRSLTGRGASLARHDLQGSDAIGQPPRFLRAAQRSADRSRPYRWCPARRCVRRINKMVGAVGIEPTTSPVWSERSVCTPALRWIRNDGLRGIDLGDPGHHCDHLSWSRAWVRRTSLWRRYCLAPWPRQLQSSKAHWSIRHDINARVASLAAFAVPFRLRQAGSG